MTETIKLMRPVPLEFRLSSPYGEREINGKKEFHHGYDFAVPVGTPVVACEDGAAFRCGWQDEIDHGVGFGFRVWQEIERTEGDQKRRFYIFYGHLSKISIKEGDRIKKGQEIGLSGNTGRTTGPHLHMEVREKNTSNRLLVEWV